MAEWGLVRVATITEEDVEEEVVGEDGTVATIANPTPAAKENGIDPDTSSDSESKRGSVIEREDSLVEKDDVSLTSILQSISFDTKPIHIPLLRDTQTLPSRLPTSRPSSTGSSCSPPRGSPSRTTPSRNSPTPPSPSSPTSARRKFTQRRGNKGPGFTMTLSDKFVTELTLHDPGTFNASQGGTNAGQICLGLFLATDMITGDHSVYKVSPVSPLAVLKLKPQDRLIRLNGLMVSGWSHSCVLEWVRNLSLVEATQQSDSPRELTLCLEYRRAGKSVRAACESPSTRQILATIAIAKKRASVRNVKETDTGLHYRHTTICRMGLGPPSASSSPQQPQGLPRFLASRVLPDGGIGLGVVEGQEADNQEAQFLLHTFEVSASLHEGRGSGGEMTVVEATSPSSWFLLPCSLTHLTFMHCPWSAMQGMSQADPRCFTFHPTPDKRGIRVEGLYTGNFLSAGEGGGVVLVSREDTDAHLPDSTIFQILPTEH